MDVLILEKRRIRVNGILLYTILFVLVFGLLFYFSINKASKKEKQFTVDEAAYAKR